MTVKWRRAAGLVSLLGATCFAAVPARGKPAEATPFAVSAQPVTGPQGPSIRLTVKNTAKQPQRFWTQAPDYNVRRWKTDDRRIFLPAPPTHKNCTQACRHRVVLAPGASHTQTVKLGFGVGLPDSGTVKVRFATLQPDWDLVDNPSPSPREKYEPREYWSRPVSLSVPPVAQRGDFPFMPR